MSLGYHLGTVAVTVGLIGLAASSPAGAQGTSPRPRPGLTSQQTKEAINLAKGAMTQLRNKTEGATRPDADPREYVVNVELLAGKEPEAPAKGEKKEGKEEAKPEEKAPSPKAVVTSYRYFDDITVFSTVDLETGRVVAVEAVQHMRTPLSDAEFDDAIELAREKSDEVKQLYERYRDQIKVYPQFSQFNMGDDPRVHRVVHLTYRIGKHDLSYPRPQVDLTTREVVTPSAEPDPDARPRRR